MKLFKFTLLGLLLAFAGTTYAQQADAERLEALVTTLASDDFKGRGFGTSDGTKAANYIIQQFRSAVIQPIWADGYLHPFDYRDGILNIRGNNIVGVIHSEDPELSEEYIILGAHYDHLGWELDGTDTVVYNGADDNASGVASIIEIGRLLNENKEWLGRSVIIIAFDGEEIGLIGSNAFVDAKILGEDPLISKESIVAMINLDMVGMYEAHGGVDLLGWGLLKDSEQILNDAKKDSPIEITKTTGSIPGRTDTTPFGNIGIPAIHVFTDTESPYHKPEDDSDLLDYEGMAVIVDFVTTVVNNISTIPELPKSKEMEKIAEQGSMKRFNPGVVLNIGSSNFDYKEEYY
jgi:aminopeptidase YwaD